MVTFDVRTTCRNEMVEVTDRVRSAVAAAGVRSGVAMVFVPHTTAGVTINENADPDVVHDVLRQLDEMVPWRQPFHRHGEGNSAAHVKATMVGSSAAVPIDGGRPVLGRWQGVFLCEFDGPRQRQVQVLVRSTDAP